MKRQFVVDLLFLLFLNLLIKPFWILGVEPTVQNAVGNSGYGEYWVLFNFSILFNIILDIGLTNYNNRNIAQNNSLVTEHFSNLFPLKLFLGFIYLIITIIAAYFNGFDSRYVKLLSILCLNQFLLSFILYLRSNLQGLHQFKTDTFISVMDRFIMIILSFLVLKYEIFGVKMNIMNFTYIQTFALFTTCIIGFISVYTHLDKFKPEINFKLSLNIIKKSAPFAVLVLLMAFYNRFDSLMLEKILPKGSEKGSGSYEAGVYARAFRLLDSANMIAYLFSVQLLPKFSKMLKEKSKVDELVKLASILLIVPAILVSMVTFFFSAEITTLINGHNNDNSSSILGILMFCFTPMASVYIFGTLLTSNGNLRQLNYMALTGVFLNIVLNFILIPRFFALGAAYASFLTQTIAAAIQIYMAYKMFHFRFNFQLILKILLFVILTFAATYCLKNYTSIFWLLQIMIVSLIGLIIMTFTGMLNFKSAIKLFKPE
jgi:O-antigen/teichoic acid export membrane protein